MFRMNIKKAKTRTGTKKMSVGKEEKGFTLIEVLITIFILAVVCITLISVFIYGFNLLAKTKQVTLATQVAQLEVEEYRNKAFDDIPISLPYSENVTFDQANFPILFTDDEAAYLRNGQMTMTIQEGGGTDIVKLTVSITWDYRNRQMQKDVVTYITRDGINRR